MKVFSMKSLLKSCSSFSFSALKMPWLQKVGGRCLLVALMGTSSIGLAQQQIQYMERIPGWSSRNIFDLAERRNPMPTVRELVEKYPRIINGKFEDDMTLFCASAIFRSFEIAQFLLKKGAKVDQFCRLYNSSFTLLRTSGNSTDLELVYYAGAKEKFSFETWKLFIEANDNLDPVSFSMLLSQWQLNTVHTEDVVEFLNSKKMQGWIERDGGQPSAFSAADLYVYHYLFHLDLEENETLDRLMLLPYRIWPEFNRRAVELFLERRFREPNKTFANHTSLLGKPDFGTKPLGPLDSLKNHSALLIWHVFWKFKNQSARNREVSDLKAILNSKVIQDYIFQDVGQKVYFSKEDVSLVWQNVVRQKMGSGPMPDLLELLRLWPQLKVDALLDFLIKTRESEVVDLFVRKYQDQLRELGLQNGQNKEDF